METKEEKQLKLDKRYIRMASIWAENSYCERRQVGALIVKDKMSERQKPLPPCRWKPSCWRRTAPIWPRSRSGAAAMTRASCRSWQKR